MSNSSAHAGQSIPHGTIGGNPPRFSGLALFVGLLAGLLPPAPILAGDEPKVLPAPPEVLSAAVPEEPAWDRAELIREIREQERQASLQAIGRARAEAEREARSQVRAELESEMQRLRGDLEAERSGRASAEAALEGVRAELARNRSRTELRASGQDGEARELRALRGQMAEREAERDAALTQQGLLEERVRAAESGNASLREELREKDRELDLANANLRRATEEARDLRRAAQTTADRTPEPASCEAPVQEAYQRALVDCEREWRQRARAGEDAMQESRAMQASLEGLETDNQELRRQLRQLREQPPAQDATSVREAYERGRREARAELASRPPATAADEGMRVRIRELEGSLQGSRRELANVLGRLAEKDEEITRLKDELESAAASRPVPAEVVVAESRLRRSLEKECDSRLERAVEEERASCGGNPVEAEAEANRRAVARLDELYREIQEQTKSKVDRARKEERARADRAFRSVLREIGSREERNAAREIWEERD